MKSVLPGRWFSHVLAGAVLCAVALISPRAVSAQGVIAGRITDAVSSQPLADAKLIVVGTNASGSSGQDGRYRLTNVRVGTVDVQILRVGYTSVKKTVTVTDGGTQTLDVSMTIAVVQLQEVVTTATGQQRKVELGNALATIDAAKRAEAAPVRDITEMITAQSPSVAVTPGNYTGAAAQIRIRGLSSISNSGPPIYIVDGVRIDASTGIGLTGGGAVTSRVNDILPQDIEDIEIVKGPSAATLYGTNAANGVVVITTKRGKAGRTNWNFQTEAGTLDDRNPYPNTWANWGHCTGTGCTAAEQANPIRCLLTTMEPNGIRSNATCVSDSITSANLLTAKGLSPIALGNRNLNTLQVSGGTELVRFFTAGTLENEAGPLKMPDFSIAHLDSLNTPIRSEWIRPSNLQRASFRANINATVSPKFELQATSSFFKSDTRGAQSDNNVNSYYYNALTSPGFIPTNLNLCVTTKGAACLGYTGVGSLGQNLHGYGGYTPAEIFQSYQKEGNQRFGGTATAQWRPFSWLQNDATTGADLVALDIVAHCYLNECADFSTTRQGSVSEQHANTRQFTTNVTSTATWNPRLWANAKTSVGVQYLNSESDGTTASASLLGPGVETVAQASSRSASNTAPTATKTLGVFSQEQVALRDRLFLTAGVRTDQNSAFGAKLKRVFYPKYSLSWLASDEPFFPNPHNFFDQVRMRMAYGESGIQPGSTTALQTFATSTVHIANTDQSALAASNIGNANLRPERTLEWEGGFDIRMLNNRVNTEITYYSKQTHDALEAYSYAPSAGASSTITRNLGGVKNAGLEVQVTTQLMDRRNFGWDVTVGGSHNKNKVMYLGSDDAGNPLPPTPRTSTSRTIPGYPLGSLWYEPYTWADDNHDGIITANEVHAADITKGDSAQYVGPSFPTDLVNVSTGVDLFNRRVRLQVLANYQGGFNKLNNTMSFLCPQTVGCPTTQLPSTALAGTGRALVAERDPTSGMRTEPRSVAGNLNFWRLREVTASFRCRTPSAAASSKSPGANVVLGARNLHVWTSYANEDPKANHQHR